MSADRLREAARVLREWAEMAQLAWGEERWGTDIGWHEGLGSTWDVTTPTPPILVAATGCEEVAAFIATMHPGVALAVAGWLDKSAETWERLEDDLRDLEGAPTIEQVYGYDFTEALAVADAILGGTQ